MKLAEELSKERERRGWSLRAVARELGVAPGTYEGWEKGWREPEKESWPVIAQYLNVPMPVILSYLDLLTAEQAEQLNGATRPYVKSPRRDLALANAS